jgi:protein TonB
MSTKLSANKAVLGLIATVLFAGAAHAAAPVPVNDDECKTDYPRMSLANEEQGTVSMRLLVSAGGDVKDSKIDKSSGFKSLDKAAVRSLTACKFKPGSKNGSPADTWTRVDYAWKID